MLSHHPAYFDEAWSMDYIEDIARRGLPTDVDTLVGRGMSGAVVVPRLAERLGLKWAIIRKDDGSHSFTHWLGDIGERWAFVDDFIDTGDTLDATIEGVRLAARHAATAVPTFVGALLYSRPGWLPAGKDSWETEAILDPMEA